MFFPTKNQFDSNKNDPDVVDEFVFNRSQKKFEWVIVVVCVSLMQSFCWYRISFCVQELSGISKNSSHKPDIQEDTEVLFEPTELNTYKESFHLLDTCADVIRSCLNQQRVVPTSSEETSDGVNQLRLDLNCIKLNVASSLYLQNGKMAQIVDKLKKSLIVWFWWDLLMAFCDASCLFNSS